jgi:glutamate synthase (NADPH/NADH) small chain
MRNEPNELEANLRKGTFDEVSLGFSKQQVMAEADRCLSCKSQPCVKNCPVHVDIPTFLAQVKQDKIDDALATILKTNPLPGVCGRVCPQESQCEAACVLTKVNQAVNIGQCERYVADYGSWVSSKREAINKKVAIVGAGPAGIACAYTLSNAGISVDIYDSWDQMGGVLRYGIPDFRLPKAVVDLEIDRLMNELITFKKNTVIGKTITLDQLKEQQVDAIFIASGAGLPEFVEMEHSDAIGVFSANEFLTRINTFSAHLDNHDTPLYPMKKTIVIGGGNVALDAARCALRLKVDVTIVYRRTIKHMPARLAEVEHALAEGIEVKERLSPKAVIVDEHYKMTGILFQPTKFVMVDGKEKVVEDVDQQPIIIEADSCIVAVGTSPNPLLNSTLPQLKLNRWKSIEVDEHLESSIPMVYAGGDAVLGSATVIAALGQGKKAALSIIERLG